VDTYRPGDQIVTTVENVPDGITPTVGILAQDDTVMVSQSSAGVTERVTGSGIWRATITLPGGTPDGVYTPLWVAGTASAQDDPFLVSSTGQAPGGPTEGPAYATAVQLDDYAPSLDLDQDTADRLLTAASAVVDGLLGARPVITEGGWAGRKVDPTLLEAWQATALAAATCAQAQYANAIGPDADVRGTALKTSGPTFSVERTPPPGGGRIGPAVPALVTATRLKRSWAPMTPSAVGPPGRH
jgi:hypothetical protein